MNWTLLPELIKAMAALFWPTALIAAFLLFRPQIRRLFDTVIASVGRGASVELFSFKLKGPVIRDPGHSVTGADLYKLEGIELRAATRDDFEARNGIRHESRFVRLVHRVSSNGRKDFPYDISVYLKIEEFLSVYGMDVGAERARINDIDRVEYYLGHFFGEDEFGSWFVVRSAEAQFAVRFATADEVSCVARVIFHDGHVATLYRYCDLEMGATVREISTAAGAQAGD